MFISYAHGSEVASVLLWRAWRGGGVGSVRTVRTLLDQSSRRRRGKNMMKEVNKRETGRLRTEGQRSATHRVLRKKHIKTQNKSTVCTVYNI